MDDTLDIDVLDIPILDSYWCGICHQDIPVDDRSPNGLMRHLCIWDLFKRVANYFVNGDRLGHVPHMSGILPDPRWRN